MKQAELDNNVLGIADKGTDFASIACDLRRQGDPDARRVETELMMLRNILSALSDYDVDSTLLSDEDIDYLLELATDILHISPSKSVSQTFTSTLFDYVKPVYINNLERDNMNPVSDTPWKITAHDLVAQTITVDQILPLDILEYGDTWKTRWTLHTLIGNYVQISSIDFANKKITYSYKKGALSVGQRARFLNPFRSFYLDPAEYVIDNNAWATTYVSAAGVWLHSDGTYRMAINGWDSAHGMTGLYQSADLITWTEVTGAFYYHAGVHPFDESWCVGGATHWAASSPLKIPGTNNYAHPFQGLNAAGRGEVGIVIHDEDFNIVTMPATGIVIPGYPLDATHHYIPGGIVYHNGRYRMTVEYRNTTTGEYTILLLTLDHPSTYLVTAVEVVVPTRVPNSYCQLTLLNPCPLVFNDVLYIFIGGENNNLTNSPLLANHVGGIWYKSGNNWISSKENPLFINPIDMDEIYPNTAWGEDHLGASWSFIVVNDFLNCFISMCNGANTYKIGRTIMDLK